MRRNALRRVELQRLSSMWDEAKEEGIKAKAQRESGTDNDPLPKPLVLRPAAMRLVKVGAV